MRNLPIGVGMCDMRITLDRVITLSCPVHRVTVTFGGKWQGTFGIIWPGGLMRDLAAARATAEHLPVRSWWSRSCSSAGVLSRSASSTISSSAYGPQLLLSLASSFGVWSSHSMPQLSRSCRT